MAQRPADPKRARRKPLIIMVGIVAAALAAFLLAACGDDGGGTATPTATATQPPTQTATPPPQLSGTIEGDGSSTVFPISEAVAEEFKEVQTGVDVVVGISGTGGGFKKFCNGETDFSDASRCPGLESGHGGPLRPASGAGARP